MFLRRYLNRRRVTGVSRVGAHKRLGVFVASLLVVVCTFVMSPDAFAQREIYVHNATKFDLVFGRTQLSSKIPLSSHAWNQEALAVAPGTTALLLWVNKSSGLKRKVNYDFATRVKVVKEFGDRTLQSFVINVRQRGLGLLGRLKAGIDEQSLTDHTTPRTYRKGKMAVRYWASGLDFHYCFGHPCINRDADDALERASNQAKDRAKESNQITRNKAFKRIPMGERSFRKFRSKARANRYAWVNHYLLSLVSAIVYEKSHSWRRKSFRELGITQVGFLDRNNMKNPLARREALQAGQGPVETAILKLSDGNIIVACRGTQGLNDYMTDLRAARVARKYFGNAKIGKGYADALSGVYDEVVSTLKAHAKPGAKIWFTGHSLGGAVAQLLAHRITVAKSRLKVHAVVTFGQPPPGSRSWAKHYKKSGLAGRTVRWIDHRDAVPNLLMKLGYGHSGRSNLIDWPRTKVLFNRPQTHLGVTSRTWDDHPITRYAIRIWQLMPRKLRRGLRSPRHFLGEVNGESPTY